MSVKISSNISSLRWPYVFALSFISLFLLVESASGQSFEIRLVHPQNSEIIKSTVPKIDLSGYERIFDGNEELWISKTIDIDVSDLKEANVEPQNFPTEEEIKRCKELSPDCTLGPVPPGVRCFFTADGAKRLSEFSARYMYQRVAIILDGKLLSSPIIRVPLDSGTMVFTSREESEKVLAAIAARINALILLYRNSRSPQA